MLGGSCRSLARFGLRSAVSAASDAIHTMASTPSLSAQQAATQDEVCSFESLPLADQEDARLGSLQFQGRKTITTPNFLAISSRGTVPHITQDLMRSQTSINGIYAAFEDYAEKLPNPPTVASFPCSENESPLRRFIMLQDDALLVVGPRRLPPVAAAMANRATSLSIFTAVGFRQLEIPAYIEGITQFRPDIAVGIADIEHGKPTPGLNRKEKMDERTLAWVRGLQNQLQTPLPSNRRFTSLWPPILPIEYELQRSYLEYLEEQPATSFGGITLYSTDNLPDIPKHFRSLPRLVLNDPSSPQAVITSISLGADLFTIPFISAASEAGHAFNFGFPPSTSSASSRLPLSIDLWSPDHAAVLEPLVPQCPCYACTNHHRAYIHHLLNAKEMLAWVLLQLHNHHVMESFFTGIRASLKEGTFVDSADRFRRVYESEFPPFSGQGPRIRGYHAASKGGGEPKRNKAAYRKLQADREKGTEIANGREKTEMGDEGVEKMESVEGGLFGEAESEEETPFDQLYDTSNAESSKSE